MQLPVKPSKRGPRSHERLDTYGRIQTHILGEGIFPVLDISREGMKAQLPYAIPPGSRRDIYLLLERWDVFAEGTVCWNRALWTRRPDGSPQQAYLHGFSLQIVVGEENFTKLLDFARRERERGSESRIDLESGVPAQVDVTSSAVVKALSPQAVFLELGAPAPIGSTARVTFELQSQRIELRGRVRFCDRLSSAEAEPIYAVGLDLSELADEDRSRVAELIERSRRSL